jgi:hypothetical protein
LDDSLIRVPPDEEGLNKKRTSASIKPRIDMWVYCATRPWEFFRSRLEAGTTSQEAAKTPLTEWVGFRFEIASRKAGRTPPRSRYVE